MPWIMVDEADGSVMQWPAKPPRGMSVPRQPSTTEVYPGGLRWYVAQARPDLAWGETLAEAQPAKVGGEWHQQWQVQSITLAEAKQRLAQMAAEIFVGKVTAPTPSQLLSSGYVGAVQARDSRFKPKLDDVADRIQAAASVAEAHAIYRELAEYE